MIILELLRQFYLNPFGAKDTAFVITVASGARTTGNGIAVGGEAAGKQVNAFPAADGKREVNVVDEELAHLLQIPAKSAA